MILSKLFGILDKRDRRSLVTLFLLRQFAVLLDFLAMGLVIIILTGQDLSESTFVGDIFAAWAPSSALITALAVILFFFRGFFVLFTSALFLRKVSQIESKMSSRVVESDNVGFSNMNDLPQRRIENLQLGVITSARRLFTELFQHLQNVVGEALAILSLAVLGFALATQEFFILLLLVGSLAVILWIFSGKPSKLLASKNQNSEAEIYRILKIIVEGRTQFLQAGSFDNWIKYYERVRRKLASSTALLRVIGLFPRYALETFLIGGLLILVSLEPGSRIVGQDVNLELLVVFALRLVSAMVPLQTSLTAMQATLVGARPFFDRLLAGYDSSTTKSPKAPESEHKTGVRSLKLVRIDDVTREINGRALFLPVSTTLFPKNVYAVAGESGSGKSTFLSLLGSQLGGMRGTVEYQYESGLPDDRTAFYLDPYPVVFEGSLLELVSGQPPGVGFSEHERNLVLESLRAAQIWNEIEKKGIVLDARIVPDKVFSTGQLQRIGIARALFSGRSLLLLDEPTSALDDATSRAIYSSLVEHAVNNNAIVVVATHDRTFIGQSDIIEIQGIGSTS